MPSVVLEGLHNRNIRAISHFVVDYVGCSLWSVFTSRQRWVLLLLKFLKHKELEAIVAALLTFYCHNWQSDELTSCWSQTKICPPLPIKPKHFYTLVFVQIKKTRCNILCYAKVDAHWLHCNAVCFIATLYLKGCLAFFMCAQLVDTSLHCCSDNEVVGS